MKNESKPAQGANETSINNDPVAVAGEAVKKRTGRPSIEDMYNELDRATGAGPAQATSETFIVTDQDRQLFRETAKSVTVLIDVLAVNAFQNQMSSLGYGRADIVEFTSKIPMKPELREQMVNSGTLLAEKYGFIRIGPEAAFAACCLTYAYSLMELKKAIVANAPQQQKTE